MNLESLSKQKVLRKIKTGRIRLKAEDLQKALNPAVWPLRVKVREFVHYSKRNQQNKEKSKNSDQTQSVSPSGNQQEKGTSCCHLIAMQHLKEMLVGTIKCSSGIYK